MLNRAAMGFLRSKIKVKSSKCFCRGIFLFVPFNPLSYVWTMHRCFKNVPAKFQSRPKCLAGFFFKSEKDNDDRRKTFFLASCSEHSFLIHRVVTMEYRSSDRWRAVRTLRALQTSAVLRQANSDWFFFILELWVFVPDHVASVRLFFESKGAVVRTNLIPKTVAIEKEIVCEVVRGDKHNLRICKSQRANQCHSFRTVYWSVLCNLLIFSGCACHLKQLHA